MATRADVRLKTADRAFFGHPRGLATLFMTELWERFSYYGMRALLILFMTAPQQAGGLGFDVAKAGAVYGLFTAMVYLLSLPGGWVADRWLGQRRAVLYGGVIIAAGNYLLATPSLTAFYFGLALVACGTGLLKPNVSVMVGQLYERGDSRRDAGFSIFYMGINLGAFLAPLACGYLGQRVNWHLGFALAGTGMLAGLAQYVAGGRHLGEAGKWPAGAGSVAETLAHRRKTLKILAGSLVFVGGLALADAAGLVQITAQGLSDALGVVLAASVVAFFVWALFLGDWERQERRRLAVIGLLFLASTVFWALFEQAGSTLNLFAERNTNKTVWGFTFPASWFQSLNALLIVALAPVFAWLWVRLGSREPSSAAKFAWGLAAAGLGFAVLALGASVAQRGVQVSPLWLVGVYVLHTVGELCLSPVGLSAMTKLAPARISSLVMGVWFLSISVGNYLGARVAMLYERLSLSELFGVVAGVGLGAGMVMAVLAAPIRKLMGDVK
ncbi:MAG: peptide MFS transporter [Bryobacterales bacterium]|nr:peptide MFS transporter [Bryobacteraceae bacterium]MDW8356077.1 peptide MFS transporter [Bryobacterales bacterium]